MLEFPPLFPLFPVQRSPEARFERFGVKDSQLFGKPLLQLGNQARPPSRSQATAAAEVPRALAARPQRTPVPESAPTYGGPFGFRKPTPGTGLGRLVDLQA